MNTLEIITNITNKTHFYNIDNDNTDEPSEYRKPTINEILDHINMSLEQVKNQMENHTMGRITKDDVELLESRIDKTELMLENKKPTY